MRGVISLIAVLSLAVPGFAGVIDTVVDTTPGGATVDANVGVGEYVGTVSGGGGGFGGPVGGATLSVDSDANGVYFGFSNLGDFSGNSIRIYLDTVAGGYNELSDGAGFNDFDDFGRERVSRPAADGLTLPFDADRGWIISDAFGGFQALFELQPGGNGSLNFAGNGVVADPVGSGPTNPTIELFVPYVDLGTTAGSTVDFVVIYANNNDQDSAFMSDEGFPFQVQGGNPGFGPVTLNDFHRIVTVPEPASLSLLAIGMLMLRRRR